jgi:hypothetical protein
MDWTMVPSQAVVLHVVSVTADSATVRISNTAAAPVFYTVLTTTFEGRFGRNLLLVPPQSSRTVLFAFETSATAVAAAEALVTPTAAQFESSLSVDWLNKHYA